MNEDDMSVRGEWNALLEKNDDDFVKYILNSLMIRPEETKVVKENGKSKFGVQLSSIERSIKNNANPEKKRINLSIYESNPLLENSL